MNKQQAYIAALELTIRALESAFVRANAAEVLRPLQPLSERWRLSEPERDAAERAELAAYDVAPEHWGARLALMSAFESLHAALRVLAEPAAHHDRHAAAWREAMARAREAARLAGEAARVFEMPDPRDVQTAPGPRAPGPRPPARPAPRGDLGWHQPPDF